MGGQLEPGVSDWIDGFLAATFLIEGKYDRYAALRDAYLKKREAAGQPTVGYRADTGEPLPTSPEDHTKPGSECKHCGHSDLLIAAQNMACASHVIAGTRELEALRAAIAKASRP